MKIHWVNLKRKLAMDQLGIEKRLSLSYLFCIILGGIASITTGIPWGHWYRTLDQCVGRNCSCILYGQNTVSRFLGKSLAHLILNSADLQYLHL